jgi:hypothetical protein
VSTSGTTLKHVDRIEDLIEPSVGIGNLMGSQVIEDALEILGHLRRQPDLGHARLGGSGVVAVLDGSWARRRFPRHPPLQVAAHRFPWDGFARFDELCIALIGDLMEVGAALLGRHMLGDRGKHEGVGGLPGTGRCPGDAIFEVIR